MFITKLNVVVVVNMTIFIMVYGSSIISVASVISEVTLPTIVVQIDVT
jgi:hypothetical protein